jgi:protein TonB
MQRNLVQPDDLEAGEKVVVMVRFVVEKDGTIAAATLLNSGRKDLDENVLRTVQKMPKWVPGMQHGNRVAVYFKLPVTFLAQEQ